MLNSFHQYPFVRLLLPLIAGIAVASIGGRASLPPGYVLASLIVVIALALLSWRYLNWRKRWIFGCGLFLAIMMCGYELTRLKTEKLHNTFFGKCYQFGDLWTARLTEPIQEKDNSNKAVVMVTGITKKGSLGDYPWQGYRLFLERYVIVGLTLWRLPDAQCKT